MVNTFETIRDLLARNFSIAIMDWQGQGGSYRFNDDNTRQHSMGFEHDIEDFEQFLTILDERKIGQTDKKVIIGHSMGGHLALRYILDNPDTVAGAILIAPMLDINIPPQFKYIASGLISTMLFLGQGNKHVPEMGPWTPEAYEKIKPLISSDEKRRSLLGQYYENDPQLQCGGVTWNWLEEAMRSNSYINKTADTTSADIPILFALAENEQVVVNEAAVRIANKLPNAVLEVIKDSQHSIHMERPPIRKALWNAIDCFTQKHLHL